MRTPTSRPSSGTTPTARRSPPDARRATRTGTRGAATRRHGDTATRRHGDTATRRHGDTARRGGLRPRRNGRRHGLRRHRRGAYPYERDVFHFPPIL
ncbi:hypothetical protein C6P96_17870 [Burkholderia multivorans]|nr:hypothetical protein C6P95_10985 [Burkholderia multivorans]PRF10558.1 hypothetical protein C6P96_17870 [Burkholderia multivorans]